MHDIFNTIGSSRFSSLYIVRHISVVTFRKKLVNVIAIWFEPTALSKVAGTFDSEVRIEIDLITSLTFQVNSVSDSDYLILVVASIYETSIFFLVPL